MSNQITCPYCGETVRIMVSVCPETIGRSERPSQDLVEEENQVLRELLAAYKRVINHEGACSNCEIRVCVEGWENREKVMILHAKLEMVE